MKKQRYEVMPVSASCGHEFNATVIDTHKTSYEKDICECFDLKDAEFIANALNAQQVKTVTIPAREHNELSYAATLLQALRDGGVEDWEGWESAVETAEENHDGEIPHE